MSLGWIFTARLGVRQSPGHSRLFTSLISGQVVRSILILDNQSLVISAIELFRGTLSRVSVYLREVIQEGLKCNAAAMILAHNHPSRFVESSNADRDITGRIFSAAELSDIRALDHIAVGDSECVSFVERGWI
jgi:DNA repair protein RadC